jgi:hypothetical protein
LIPVHRYFFAYIYKMGGSNSKTSQLNESITDIAMSVASKSSTNTSAVVKQSMNFSWSGTVRDVDIVQDGKVDLRVMANSDVNAEMQSEIMNKIVAKLDEVKTDFPQITESNTDTEIRNIVQNNVSNTFSVESLDTMSAMVDQEMNIFQGKDGVAEGIRITQSGEVLAEMVRSMSTDIVSTLVAGTDLESTVKKETKFFVSDFADSLFDGIGGLGALSGSTKLMIVVLGFFMLVAAIYYATGTSSVGSKQYMSQRYSQQAYRYDPRTQGYAQPAQVYAQQAQGYAQPAQVYAQQAQGYAQPVPGYSQQVHGYAPLAKRYAPLAKRYAPKKPSVPEADMNMPPMRNAYTAGGTFSEKVKGFWNSS